MDYKKLILAFLVFYFVLLLAVRTPTISHDEGSPAIDSLFYHEFMKDFVKDPGIISNAKEYAFNFYAQYPALYIIRRPPLYPLITSFLFFVFGVNFLTVKLLSIFFSVVSLYLVYLLGKEFYDERAGFYSAIVLSFATYFLLYSRMALLDVPLIFFTLLSLYLFRKALKGKERYFYYLGVSLGLGFLIRRNIIITTLILLVYFLYRVDVRENLSNIFKSAIPFALVSSPFWIILLFYKGMEATMYALGGVTLGKCSMFAPACNFFTHLYYYPLVIFYMIFPLIFLLPLAYFLWNRDPSREDMFLIFFTVFYLVATTLTSDKQPKYILPVLPILSLLFVKVSLDIKKYGRYILALGIAGCIAMTVLMPNPLTSADQLNSDASPAAEYINQRIDKNANIFSISNTVMANAVVFHFARMNDFRNAIIRERYNCYHNKFNRSQYLDYLNKYNIQYIVGSEEPKRNPLEEIVENHFTKVTEKGNYLIYRMKEKRNYTSPNKVCNYNCKLSRDFCTTINN